MAKDKHTSSILAYISVYSYANESVFLCVCVWIDLCVRACHLSQPRGMLLNPSGVCCLQPEDETLNMSLIKKRQSCIICCGFRLNAGYSLSYFRPYYC